MPQAKASPGSTNPPRMPRHAARGRGAVAGSVALFCVYVYEIRAQMPSRIRREIPNTAFNRRNQVALSVELQPPSHGEPLGGEHVGAVHPATTPRGGALAGANLHLAVVRVAELADAPERGGLV